MIKEPFLCSIDSDDKGSICGACISSKEMFSALELTTATCASFSPIPLVSGLLSGLHDTASAATLILSLLALWMMESSIPHPLHHLANLQGKRICLEPRIHIRLYRIMQIVCGGKLSRFCFQPRKFSSEFFIRCFLD